MVSCYLGWCVTGLIFWMLERNDSRVRFHAAQSVLAFGTISLLIVVLAAVGLLALSFAPSFFFDVLVSLGFVATIFGFGLWVGSVWSAARNHDWWMPVFGAYAQRAVRQDALVALGRPWHRPNPTQHGTKGF